MTTLTDIERDLQCLNEMLIVKGWHNPRCEFNLDTRPWFKIEAAHPVSGGDRLYKYINGDDYNDAYRKAAAEIQSLPSGEEAARQDFQKALGRLIDKGNSLGIDAAFLNPLTEQMRLLSENIITDQS